MAHGRLDLFASSKTARRSDDVREILAGNGFRGGSARPPGSRTVSYFSDVTNLCWFLEPDLASEIRRLHLVVGNAVVADDSFIIVGTGSSQLFQAALFALSTSPEVVAASAGPVPVISSVPYYSSYPAAADLLRSRLFRWAGDTSSFKQSNKPYIEVVCSPSNPDGSMKATSVGSSNGR
ncbi:hypothetical protein HPP92_000281 [Vanilla planifolia]|uniref:Alliinase C-terminal domain-containing protein n=1 Tax=Vanilla planifolia TaxID=51239 RepID=A0A835RXS5_VANPL|nr:hypothetical protein HPP92_000281 [Vanilla planifolia]